MAFLIVLVDHVSLADNIILLNADGSLAYSGTPQESNFVKPDNVPTERADSDIIECSNEEDKEHISTTKYGNNEKHGLSRQVGDFSVWWYYAKSIGAWRTIAAITIITVNVVASNFPSTYLFAH
jgi:hypothetical protein